MSNGIGMSMVGGAALAALLVAVAVSPGRRRDGADGMALAGYDPRKAAELSAYLLDKAGGRMDKLKLSKMLYLVERKSIGTWGEPAIYDEYFSIAEGPVCSNALDGLNQKGRQKGTFDLFIARDRATDVVSRKAGAAFERLSPAVREVADAVWGEHGGKSTRELVEWTHGHLPEYRSTPRARIPITDFEVAKAVGLKDPEGYAEAVADARDMAANDPFA